MGPRDLATKIGVAAGGTVIVAILISVRFCGDVSVADRPPRPDTSKPSIVIAEPEPNASVERYLAGVARDAGRAAVPTPTAADLGRALRFERDDTARTLDTDGATVDVLGLRIAARTYKAEGSEKLLVLQVQNLGDTPRAYFIETKVSSGDAACFGRTLVPHNGMVVVPGRIETRSECGYKRGMELYVGRVESVEVPPLAAFYLSRVKPQAVGANERIAASGHAPALPSGTQPCGISMPQTVRQAMQVGDTKWRDLVDFYARHSCEDYEFPEGYKSFTSDGERTLPVVP